jgi:hypothetical protein
LIDATPRLLLGYVQFGGAGNKNRNLHDVAEFTVLAFEGFGKWLPSGYVHALRLSHITMTVGEARKAPQRDAAGRMR